MSVSDRKEPGTGKVQNLCGSCLHLFNCALGVGEGKKENVSWIGRASHESQGLGFYFPSSGELLKKQKVFNEEDMMKLIYS